MNQLNLLKNRHGRRHAELYTDVYVQKDYPYIRD